MERLLKTGGAILRHKDSKRDQNALWINIASIRWKLETEKKKTYVARNKLLLIHLNLITLST